MTRANRSDGSHDVPRINIWYRPAPSPGPGGWTLVAESVALEDLRDELASWRGPLPRHGDLVRATYSRGRSDVALFVYDGDRGAFREVTSVYRSSADWLALWEGTHAHPAHILGCSTWLDRTRATLGACVVVGAASRLGGVPRLVGAAVALVEEVTLGAPMRRRGAPMLRTLRTLRQVTTDAATRGDPLGPEDVVDSAVLAAHELVSAVAARGARGAEATPHGVRHAVAAASAAWRALALSGADTDPVLDAVRAYVPLSLGVCAAMAMRAPLPPLAPPRRS